MRQIFRVVFLVLVLIADLHPESAQNDNIALKAKIELGRRLFYDADLSINGAMSCATCHEQKNGFADGNKVHPGALDDPGKRNVPGLANVGMYKNLTWAHNHLNGLAEQLLTPIRGTDPVEMGMNGYENEIPKRLSQNECYQKLFSIAFSEEKGLINLDTVSRALESFEKTLVSNNSLYDQKMKSFQPLPTQEAEDGKKLLFGAAKCNTCHRAPLFSDDDFHQIQPQNQASAAQFIDNGLSDVSGKLKDKNFFRTPSLRNAAITSPYWHDGSVQTLSEAIRKHNLKINQALSDEDIHKIAAFLDTLTDVSFVNNPQYAKPSKECNY